MRQHLIVDADDTLWENNIYFERAFEEFTAFLDHSSMQPEEVRAALDEIELINAKIHGYGSKNFRTQSARMLPAPLRARSVRWRPRHGHVVRRAHTGMSHGGDR